MTSAPSLTTGEIAALLGAELRGPGDVRIDGFGPLSTAGPTSLSFVRDAGHAGRWVESKAGATLVSRAVLDEPRAAPMASPTGGRAVLVVDDADTALIALLERAKVDPVRPTGAHATAVIDPSASLGEGVGAGAHVSVGPGSSVGRGTVLHAGVRIGANARVGAGCELHPNVVIGDRCVVGDNVIMHAGVVIGADGFGYRPAPDGAGLVKIPHLGNVVIGDGVEIGANTCIDRGKLGATEIGAGTKIDNLVQIGHNCVIGRCCVICGCAALAGSVVLEDGVTLAGCVGIADNLRIGRGATIAAMAGVMHDVPPGETWAGYPAHSSRQWMRHFATVRQMTEHLGSLRRLLRREGYEKEVTR